MLCNFKNLKINFKNAYGVVTNQYLKFESLNLKSQFQQKDMKVLNFENNFYSIKAKNIV